MLKKGEEERARLDMNDLIREVMRLVQGELKNRGVSSRAELADDLPRVLADRIQLRQVILKSDHECYRGHGFGFGPGTCLTGAIRKPWR